ncbi:hypothetical protein HQ590_06795 [bacterium]|nr:hypothetical protein [bacterium]
MRAKEGTFTVPTTSTGGEVFLRAHDPLACVCCQEAAGGLAAGRRAARTAKDLTQELLRVERALLPLTEDDTEAGERSPGDAVEHLVWQHSEACESERMLLEQVKDAGSKMADQQAIHETEMDQDGRARAMMVALCRDLGVSIYTDATRGIRDEMHRRKALLRRCFDWWGQDDVGRLVYADLCRFFGVPADEPGICSTGLTTEPVDSRSINPGDLHDTERSS